MLQNHQMQIILINYLERVAGYLNMSILLSNLFQRRKQSVTMTRLY